MGMTAIAGGSLHSLALKVDGTVWAWGENFGQLRDGMTTATQRLTPVQVSGLIGVLDFLTLWDDQYDFLLASDFPRQLI